MNEDFFEEQKQLLTNKMNEAVEKACYIRKMVVKQAEKLDEPDRSNVTKLLGSYGNSFDNENRMEAEFHDRFVRFLDAFVDDFCSNDARLHEVFWILGRENMDELEASFVKDGRETLKTAVHNCIFTFEDIPKLHDHAVQKLLREVDTRHLVRALLFSSDAVCEKIFKNMSQRAAQILKDDMRMYKSITTKERSVSSQNKILATLQRLEAIGEILIWETQEDFL